MSFSLVYREYRPPIDIAPWIACFWQIVGEAATGDSLLHRVLPDGCSDLVFDIEDARRGGDTPTHIVGPMSCAKVFELRNAIEIIGVRLRPGAIGAFSGIPAGCLLDSACSWWICRSRCGFRVRRSPSAPTSNRDSNC